MTTLGWFVSLLAFVISLSKALGRIERRKNGREEGKDPNIAVKEPKKLNR